MVCDYVILYINYNSPLHILLEYATKDRWMGTGGSQWEGIRATGLVGLQKGLALNIRAETCLVSIDRVQDVFQLPGVQIGIDARVSATIGVACITWSNCETSVKEVNWLNSEDDSLKGCSSQGEIHGINLHMYTILVVPSNCAQRSLINN